MLSYKSLKKEKYKILFLIIYDITLLVNYFLFKINKILFNKRIF